MEYRGHETTDLVTKIRMERRKAQKPRIEKLRRDRINGSLDEIKHLVLEALNKDISRYSKMEKADILEMTVQFLKGANTRKRMQEAIRTQAQHTPEMRIETSNQKVPRLAHDQLLVRNTDVKPISVMSPFVTSPMIAMATQPTILWLPYPSPPSSPTEQDSQTADSVSKPSITYTGNQSRSMYKTGERLSLTSHDGVMLPVWRPW
ncbi:unnamed protein product [Porites lobata]|uniref:BHLH domain-containing protein n=1 Tax=Porites lobata TaxID=104759 RepID=A0ABN8NBN1_9CNID|nr:unnamed protein product [Porites lobata]